MYANQIAMQILPPRRPADNVMILSIVRHQLHAMPYVACPMFYVDGHVVRKANQ